MNSLSNKKIEIFCGTGGVGKTTIATSRALYLAQQGKKVLLMTIDPSLRLKQLFSISEENSGNAQRINTTQELAFTGELSIFLMDAQKTLEKILGDKLKTNHILESLSKPYSGMNEIMSLIELNNLSYNENPSQLYDYIILDTPPGQHFIDFLESSNKINNFFDHSFIHFFSDSREKKVSRIVAMGIKKLLNYLKVVTGAQFIEAFTEAITVLYNRRESFLDALKLQKSLLDPNLSTWYLVTSMDQQKMGHSINMQKSLKSVTRGASNIIINKSLFEHLTKWQPSTESLSQFKNTMLTHENEIKRTCEENYNQVILFPEVIDREPLAHVNSLCLEWDKAKNSHD